MSVKWGPEAEVIKNRRRFLKKLGINYEDCVLASLNHGVEVAEVGRVDAGKYIEADALITTEKGVGLLMVTADCLPVIMFDGKKIALIHLGWRGVDKKLAIKVLKRFADPTKIEVIIGPGVRKGSYNKWGKGWEEFVGEIEDMGQWKDFIEEVNEKKSLDLVGLVKKQIGQVKNIEVSPIDTVADSNYFSHHRSFLTGESEGRFATVAMITD